MAACSARQVSPFGHEFDLEARNEGPEIGREGKRHRTLGLECSVQSRTKGHELWIQYVSHPPWGEKARGHEVSLSWRSRLSDRKKKHPAAGSYRLSLKKALPKLDSHALSRPSRLAVEYTDSVDLIVMKVSEVLKHPGYGDMQG